MVKLLKENDCIYSSYLVIKMDLKGKMIDPGTGKQTDAHEIFTVQDGNTQIMQMFAPGADGKEFKTMEIVFTRKK